MAPAKAVSSPVQCNPVATVHMADASLMQVIYLSNKIRPRAKNKPIERSTERGSALGKHPVLSAKPHSVPVTQCPVVLYVRARYENFHF